MAEENLDFNIEQLPFSLEAEQSVLGAILIEPECISRVLELLVPESFYRPQHQQLFSIMLGMFTSAQPIDFITVLEKAKAERIFASDGDAKVYLTQLVQVVPSAANVEAYAKLVQEKYYMRTLINVAKSIITNSEKSDADARGLMEFAEQKLYEIRQGKDATGLVKVDRAIFELYDKLQRISGDDKKQYVGIPTGFSALDSLTTGLNRTDLILLAARPAMGKSSFMMNIASNVAKQGHAVAIFSLEMSREQLITRMLSSDALIQVSQLRSGNLSVDDWTKLALSAQTIAKMPMYIDDTAGITVAEMKAKLRRIRNLGACYHRLPSVDVFGQTNDNRVTGSFRDHTKPKGNGKGTGCANHHPLSAFPEARISVPEIIVRYCLTYVSPVLSSRTPIWSCFCTVMNTITKTVRIRVSLSVSLPKTDMVLPIR